MELSQVILSPIISEKSQLLESIGDSIGKRTKKYSFRVHPDANKPIVKAAIKHIYNITPASVDIMVYRGKIKKFRNFPAPKPHWKKAIVTFPDGENIEFTKG